MMRIVPSSDASNPIVGREYVEETPEGEFIMTAGGSVIYRHPAVGELFANTSTAAFLKCVQAWDSYLARVSITQGEANQLRVVEELRQALANQDALTEAGFWASILQQPEWGHL